MQIKSVILDFYKFLGKDTFLCNNKIALCIYIKTSVLHKLRMIDEVQHVTESLAGRASSVQMLDLSNDEIRGVHFPPFRVDVSELTQRMAQVSPMTLFEIYKRIFRGSMPRLYENPEVDRFRYYESYLETYISRDIKDLSQVADETSFLNFMSVVAARTATNVNYEALANEVGVSAPTAKHWLSILVSSGIVALIQSYSIDRTDKTFPMTNAL